AGGRAPREVPAATAMAGATVLELAAQLRRRETAVTRAGTRVLLEGSRQRLSSQRAERELGVTFRPLDQTIADEANWYRGHGMLPAGPGRPKAGASIRLRPPRHPGDNGGGRARFSRSPGSDVEQPGARAAEAYPGLARPPARGDAPRPLGYKGSLPGPVMRGAGGRPRRSPGGRPRPPPGGRRTSGPGWRRPGARWRPNS